MKFFKLKLIVLFIGKVCIWYLGNFGKKVKIVMFKLRIINNNIVNCLGDKVVFNRDIFFCCFCFWSFNLLLDNFEYKFNLEW